MIHVLSLNHLICYLIFSLVTIRSNARTDFPPDASSAKWVLADTCQNSLYVQHKFWWVPRSTCSAEHTSRTYLLVSLVHVGNKHRDDVVSVVKVGVCLQDFTQALSGQHRQGLWTKTGIKSVSYSKSITHQFLFTSTCTLFN